MKDWHKLKPELFKKKPYHLPGCDKYDAAVKFIEQAPSARIKKMEKMAARDVYELLVRSRYVALMAARTIGIVDRFEFVPGMSYRKAAGFSAREAFNLQPPTMEEILPPSAEDRW